MTHISLYLVIYYDKSAPPAQRACSSRFSPGRQFRRVFTGTLRAALQGRMVRPSPVTGSAGSRIKVILGDSGTEYVYFVDETDGSRDWQSSNWTTGPGGLPLPLAKQLNACIAKGRYITQAVHGPDGEWFVSGRKRDGSGAHSWWGGTDATDKIKEWCGKERLRVSFGQAGAWVLQQGQNGYWCSGNVDDNLPAGSPGGCSGCGVAVVIHVMLILAGS